MVVDVLCRLYLGNVPLWCRGVPKTDDKIPGAKTCAREWDSKVALANLLWVGQSSEMRLM